MAVLGIRVLGDPVLRQMTTPVTDFGPGLQQLINDMFETMHAAHGVGLAAPQVGRTERLAVAEVKDVPYVFINPEIIEREGKLKWEEGCLSIPELYGDVMRSKRVVVQALDRDGKTFEVEGTELLGVCMQHEIDHLDGKLFIDHLSFLKRQRALANWEQEKVKYPNLIRTIVPNEALDDDDNDERI